MKLTRAQSAWILYDMANAAFALIVRTVFAPMFFLAISADVVDGGRATSMLLYAASIAGLAAGVLAPWLGAIADARGGRKRYLGFFLTVGAAATLGFCLAGPGDVWPVLALYFIGLVAYMGANSFYDSLLVDATQEEEDCVDSWVLFCVNRRKEIVNVTSLFGKMDSQILLGSLQVVSMCSDFLFQLIDSAVDVMRLGWE